MANKLHHYIAQNLRTLA